VTQPSHAYIPGQTPRHPDGSFDLLRATAQPGMSVDALAASPAFKTGLTYLDTGFFWEAHEVFEPVWMALPNPSPERSLVQALIQLANGHLKLRMSRPKAALRLAHIARNLMPPDATSLMGLSIAQIHRRIDSLQDAANGEL